MDIEMNYMERGSGTPLIMLHGNGESCEYFEPQLEFFAHKGFHCFALDSRAHGKTPRGTEPLTIRQMAKDVVDWMDERRIFQADFIGFSDGGNIMLIMAMEYPERVHRMVVDGANLDLGGVAKDAVDYVTNEYNQAAAKADSDPQSKLAMEILGLMVNDPNITPEELKQIDNKTLVMAGTEDLILKTHTELIASMIPESELEFIKGSHFCSSENPEDFNKRVLEFLRN